jgi:hypothetical protein
MYSAGVWHFSSAARFTRDGIWFGTLNVSLVENFFESGLTWAPRFMAVFFHGLGRVIGDAIKKPPGRLPEAWGGLAMSPRAAEAAAAKIAEEWGLVFAEHEVRRS